MKSSFKINIELTWSKIMAFLILVVSTWYSLANNEATVITLGIITIGGILGWKQQKDREKIKLSKDNETIN